MRTSWVWVSLCVYCTILLACGHSTIGPDPGKDGGGDAQVADGSLPLDGSAQDGGGDGGNTNSAPGWVSGSRLRARVYVSSDGAKELAGWHDNMRNEDCSFMAAVDGKTRCLPFAGAGIIIDAGYFVDAQCTMPYAIVTKGCTAKYAYHLETVNGCGTNYRYRMYQLGALSNGPTVYTKSGNQCIASAYNSSYPDLYINNTEVQPSAFADAVVQVE
jgi:hypothetical protein